MKSRGLLNIPCLRSAIVWSSVLVTVLVFFPAAMAATQSITAVGEYNMGEGETMLVAKERAVVVAMQSAAEQAGVYVESYVQTQNLQLTKDEVNVLARGVVEVLDKKFEQQFNNTGGVLFKVTIVARVNTDNIESLRRGMAEKKSEVIEDYKRIQEDYAKSLKVIEDLKTKLAAASTETQMKEVVAQIARSEQGFTAVQLVQKGDELFYNKDTREEAIAAYSQAIALNPQYEDAYKKRGWTYFTKKQWDLAIADFTNAITHTKGNVDKRVYLYRGDAYAKKIC